MAVNKWHVGSAEERTDDGILLVKIFALFSTPVGTNTAGKTWASIMAGKTSVPGWVTLDVGDFDWNELVQGTLFGKMFSVPIDIGTAAGVIRNDLNALWAKRLLVEQALIESEYQFYGYVEAV